MLNIPYSAFQMLVDDIGDVTITNDGATILKMLEVEHPAAKVNELNFWLLQNQFLNNYFLTYVAFIFNSYRSLLSWLNYKTEKLEMGQLLWSS